jgi:hypothetical protein
MHLKTFSLFSIAVLTLGAGVAAHATPITAGTYNLSDVTVTTPTVNNVPGTTYSLTGTVTVGSNGLFTSADITLNDAALGDPVFYSINTEGGPSGYDPQSYYAYVVAPVNNTGQLALYYPTTADGSGNIDLCTVAGNCNAYQDSYSQIYLASAFGYNPVDLNGGTLVAASSVTPEPESLALLGTGILSLAGVMRKRLIRRA